MRSPVHPLMVGGMKAFTAVVVAAVALSTMSGCREAAALSPLENAAPSGEVLVEGVLEALRHEDGEAMASYLVTRAEYETLLWPEMPDGEYTPFEFIWGMSYPRTRKGHRQALDRYGGMDLEFVSLEFEKEPEVYESFTLHKGATVTVRRRDTGEVGELPSIDVLVEYGGSWKLLNFDEI